jgi:hypothetical protein
MSNLLGDAVGTHQAGRRTTTIRPGPLPSGVMRPWILYSGDLCGPTAKTVADKARHDRWRVDHAESPELHGGVAVIMTQCSDPRGSSFCGSKDGNETFQIGTNSAGRTCRLRSPTGRPDGIDLFSRRLTLEKTTSSDCMTSLSERRNASSFSHADEAPIRDPRSDTLTTAESARCRPSTQQEEKRRDAGRSLARERELSGRKPARTTAATPA